MFKITLITCGNKMPNWINEGVLEFSKRLKEYIQLNIIEIPLEKRGKSSDIKRILEKEAVLIAAAIPTNSQVIALEINGLTFTSEELAAKIENIQQKTGHLCFIIGPPEGLTKHTLTLSHAQWSLSSLTLPHPLVRLVLLEAIYRAYSILHNHPYHK